MNRRIFCLVLTVAVMFTAFIPFAKADEVILFSSDGRTMMVSPEDVALWRSAGWFETKEDAQTITMFAMDGRILHIPQYYRQTYRDLGWYDTKEEVIQTMYSTDGRSLVVFKAYAEEHHKVGWYYNLSDVSTTMYDGSGNEYTVFNDNIEKERQKGLSTDKGDVMQLMFSTDSRFMYVPFYKVPEYKNLGWCEAGTKFDPAKPMVAITFDDGPGKYTDQILSILEKYNVRATFFVQGKNVSGYASVLKRAVEMGCEIGNHTWGHINLSSSSSAKISQQISSTNDAVYKATGVYPKLYRPPYGAYNKSVLNNIAMPAIMWSVDTLDWKTRNAAKTIASVDRSAKDGDIILMHDIHSPTAQAVEGVVQTLLKKGYQLVTVSELINARSSGAVSGKVYNSLK